MRLDMDKTHSLSKADHLLRYEVMKLVSKEPQRTVAHRLGIHPVTFSKFLNGKRVFKLKTAKRYFASHLPSARWKKIETQFLYEASETPTHRAVRLYKGDPGKALLTSEQFRLNSDPMLWAVWHLLDARPGEADIKWICERSGLPISKVSEHLKLLEKAGLVKRHNRYFIRVPGRFVTTDRVRNRAIRMFRRRLFPIMKHASENLCPKTEQDFWTCVFTMDPEMFERFQKLVRLFLKRFNRETKVSGTKRVYAFTTCLYPLTK